MNCQLLTFLVILALFSQARGFCGPRTLQTSLTRSAVRAAEWLRNQQDENGTYGMGHVSAFAFHSLRLIGHSVETGAEHLNAEIMKADIGSLSGGRVALYILGALATCRDPKNFYDFNLVSSLKNKLGKYPQVGFNHPFQYSLAVLALCSSGKDLGRKKFVYVNKILQDIPGHLNNSVHASGDTLAMQVMALTCVKKSNKKKGTKVNQKIKNGIDLASNELAKRQSNDSTFGENEVTAALALQALLAAGVKKTKCTKTLRWLKSRQNPDGSFINLLSTIYVTPSLIGALPYDLQDIRCPKNTTDGGENAMIEVCVELQFNVTKYSNGKTPPDPVCVTVVNGTNAHDILMEAANQHSCYNFTTENTSYGRSITSICGIYRRPADQFYWLIYIDGKSAPVGIDDLRPGHGSKLSFHYKKVNWG